MATGKITLDEGTTTNTATYTITEDAVTKHIPRSVLSNNAGADTGVAALPLQVSVANTAANATAIKVDPSAVTSPVSLASVPSHAVTNAGTFATQVTTINGQAPAFGTGVRSAATQRVTIATDDSVPVTGTVTANAGTNLNTSALALETGGNLASVATNTTNIPNTVGTAASAIPSKLLQVGGSDGTNARAIKTNTSGQLDVRPLTTSDAITANINTGQTIAVTQATASNLKVDLSGTAANTTAIKVDGSAVTQPVSLTSTTVTGTVAVTESGTWNVGSSSATGSTIPANAFYQAGNAATALPTAATAGNLTGAMFDKFGRQVVLIDGLRDITGMQTTTISASTSETTIATAVASTFIDVTSILVSNTSATATRVDFRDTTAGSVLFSLYIPAGDVRGFVVHTPLPQTTVNTNWTAQSSASVTDLRILVKYIKNK